MKIIVQIRLLLMILLLSTYFYSKISKTTSDCSSARNGGDLGPFKRGEMQKPFEDASFGLNVGEMSAIISTDSGYHLIYRIA